MDKHTALVRAERVEAEPFEPSNLDQAFRLAENLSQASLLPGHLRGKPHDVFMTLLLARDLGLTAMQGITGIHVIDGKPSVSAQTAVALVKRSPLCKYFRLVEGDERSATYETQRAGAPQPARMRYTIEDARRAGLLGKKNWQAHPAAMLRARAAMALARDEYPDVVANVYDPDELDAAAERAEVIAPPPRPFAPPPIGPAPRRETKPEPPPTKRLEPPAAEVIDASLSRAIGSPADPEADAFFGDPDRPAPAPTEEEMSGPPAEVDLISAALAQATGLDDLLALRERIGKLGGKEMTYVLGQYITALVGCYRVAADRPAIDRVDAEVASLKKQQIIKPDELERARRARGEALARIGG